MCYKLTKKSFKTPMSANFLRVAAILAFFFFAECAAGRYEIKKSRGSCLSYGHACWGAHGKRSGSQAQLFPRANEEVPSSKDEAKAKWFLSKLISPLDLRYYRDGNEVDTPNNRPRIEDLFTDLDRENMKSANDWESVSDITKNDNRLEESIENGRNIENLFKSSKFMDKRSTKQ